MAELFAAERFERVVHLAAQAGVRRPDTEPARLHRQQPRRLLERAGGCRHHDVEHLVYASSSSVYGGNTHLPFSEHHNVDHPVSMYAATKKANELMAQAGTATSIACRRPRAPVLHRIRSLGSARHGADAVHARRSSKVVRSMSSTMGRCSATSPTSMTSPWGHVRALDRLAAPDPDYRSDLPDPATSDAPYRLFNIGNHDPVPLLEFIGCIETALGRTAEKRMLPLQAGDVPSTAADVEALREWVDFAPATPIGDQALPGSSDLVPWTTTGCEAGLRRRDAAASGTGASEVPSSSRCEQAAEFIHESRNGRSGARTVTPLNQLLGWKLVVHA